MTTPAIGIVAPANSTEKSWTEDINDLLQQDNLRLSSLDPTNRDSLHHGSSMPAVPIELRPPVFAAEALRLMDPEEFSDDAMMAVE